MNNKLIINNKALRAILRYLLNHRTIGGKHFPEEKLIKSRTKYLNKQELKDFKKEYKQIINQENIKKQEIKI
jgi:hypothetical protein